MRVFWLVSLLAFAMAVLSGCKTRKQLDIVNANEADATLVLQYERGVRLRSLARHLRRPLLRLRQ
jgi:outer membrane protein assembly factor BamE (lipoprotein component of BamABCDE complex)